MAVITLRHESVEKLLKAFKIPSKNLTSFKLECQSRHDHLVTLSVTYLVEDGDIEDVERIFKDFILIEKPF